MVCLNSLLTAVALCLLQVRGSWAFPSTEGLPKIPPSAGSASPLLPTEDPFFKPPQGFETAPLGTVLRHRPLNSAPSLDNKSSLKIKNGWQMLYRTQNTEGKPIATVTTILVPYNAKPNNLFVMGMFSDSAFSGCNPSMTLQTYTREDNRWNQIQIPIVVQALSLGYYVSIPDYAGLHAAFGVGPLAGYAVLDSVRATLGSANITGLDRDPITTLFGYSAGAQAVGWATEMHPTYAPELKIAGAAFGGTPPDLHALTYLPVFQSGERSFIVPVVTLGLAHEFPAFRNWLEEELKPRPESADFYKAEEQCTTGNEKSLSFRNQSQFFRRGYDVIHEPLPQQFLTDSGIMGRRSSPTIPWYIYHSSGDDLSPVALTDKLVTQHCARGAKIEYEQNPMKLNHRYECLWGVIGAFRWLMDRYDGKPVTPGCKTSKISDVTMRGVKENLLIQGISSTLWGYMGAKVGPTGNVAKNAPKKPAKSRIMLDGPESMTLEESMRMVAAMEGKVL